MAKSNTLELLRVHLFDDIDKLKNANLASQSIERIQRMRAAFVMWNKYPLKKDAEMRDYIMSFGGVQKTAAYQDIQLLKILLGEFNETSKEFHRFKFNSMINKAYEMAEQCTANRDRNTRSRAAAYSDSASIASISRLP